MNSIPTMHNAQTIIGPPNWAEGLQRSADAKLNTTPDQGAQIGEDFESLFYSLLLKEMRQSISSDSEGGLFPGDSSDTLGGLFDLFMGKHLAASQGLGIGNAVAKYLANQLDAT